MSPKLHTLLIVSHVVHYRDRGAIYAYGPYAREIDIWADLFPEVRIAAPCRDERPPKDCLPLGRPNISIVPQREAGGDSFGAKAAQVMALPFMAAKLGTAMAGADAIHVRCPGNLGLLGAMLAPFFSRFLVAKYAGQWNGYHGEPLTVRMQRAILGSTWWHSPVTVYGDWPNQPAHVVPFFTSMMTDVQVKRAAEVAAAKGVSTPLRVLFAGTLTARKRPDALLDAVHLVQAAGVDIEAVFVGDGPDRPALEAQVARLGLGGRVRFIGALPFDEALRWYEWGDCLVLPSRHSEGWPKVVAEAMSHGLICLAVDHGQLSAMLRGRGLLMQSGEAAEIAEGLLQVARQPERFAEMRRGASAWATQYSLEGLRRALADMLVERWRLEPQALRRYAL